MPNTVFMWVKCSTSPTHYTTFYFPGSQDLRYYSVILPYIHLSERENSVGRARTLYAKQRKKAFIWKKKPTKISKLFLVQTLSIPGSRQSPNLLGQHRERTSHRCPMLILTSCLGQHQLAESTWG